MKINELGTPSYISETIEYVGEYLSETIAEYFSVTVTRLKTKKPAELFDVENPIVDLEKLASYITGIKILSKPEYREAITKDDIGFSPNSVVGLYKLFRLVPKDERQKNSQVDRVFTALKSLSPSLYRKERERLEALRSSDEHIRGEELKRLSSFSIKLNQMFNQARTKSAQVQS